MFFRSNRTRIFFLISQKKNPPNVVVRGTRNFRDVRNVRIEGSPAVAIEKITLFVPGGSPPPQAWLASLLFLSFRLVLSTEYQRYSVTRRLLLLFFFFLVVLIELLSRRFINFIYPRVVSILTTKRFIFKSQRHANIFFSTRYYPRSPLRMANIKPVGPVEPL